MHAYISYMPNPLRGVSYIKIQTNFSSYFHIYASVHTNTPNAKIVDITSPLDSTEAIECIHVYRHPINLIILCILVLPKWVTHPMYLYYICFVSLSFVILSTQWTKKTKKRNKTKLIEKWFSAICFHKPFKFVFITITKWRLALLSTLVFTWVLID